MSQNLSHYKGREFREDVEALGGRDKVAEMLGVCRASVDRWCLKPWLPWLTLFAMEALRKGLPPAQGTFASIRKAAGLTQKQMAEKLMLIEQSYQEWEWRGRNEDSNLHRLAIAWVLNEGETK